MSGKGAIACTSPLNAGLFGRYDRIANALIEESDCLLVVGCKLGEIATKRYPTAARQDPDPPGVWRRNRLLLPAECRSGDARPDLEALASVRHTRPQRAGGLAPGGRRADGRVAKQGARASRKR